MITYIKGDASRPYELFPGHPVYVIAHVTNTLPIYGAGFAKAIRELYPIAAETHLKSSRNRRLGFNVECECLLHYNLFEDYEDRTIMYPKIGTGTAYVHVVNMTAQQGTRSKNNPIPLQYNALEKCLYELKDYMDDNFGEKIPVHMPKIGSGLAGGSWPLIETMINAVLPNNNIYVYEYNPMEG